MFNLLLLTGHLVVYIHSLFCPALQLNQVCLRQYFVPHYCLRGFQYSQKMKAKIYNISLGRQILTLNEKSGTVTEIHIRKA